jgi:predicted phosphodiesterase
MTRIAFISDIHGNLVRLQQAFRDSEARQTEQYICLGDIVGSAPVGATSEQCWALLQAHHALAIKGNVDVNEWLPPQLEQEIAALPLMLEMDDGAGHRMLLVHGAYQLDPIFNSDRAVRDPLDLARRLRERGDRLMFFGHTHRPRVWQVNGQNVTLISDIRFTLDWSDPDTCYVVNVGPLQRPAPGELNNGRPCYLFYDSGAGYMEHILL